MMASFVYSHAKYYKETQWPKVFVDRKYLDTWSETRLTYKIIKFKYIVYMSWKKKVIRLITNELFIQHW